MSRTVIVVVLACFTVFLSAAQVSATARDEVNVTIIVTDASTRTPLSARISVVDSDGDALCPSEEDSCLFHDASWAHRGYFYADTACTLELMPGCTLIGVGHGFEYAPVSDTLTISADTTLVYELTRCVGMGALGWWGGDAHSHMCHPGGVYDIGACSMVCLGEAEGLSVVNVLDNTHGFAGGPLAQSSEDCVVYITEEQRSSVLGHTGFLGLTELIEPFNSDWSPLISDAAELVHAQPGAAVVCAHPISIDDFFDLDSGPSATMLARELPVGLSRGAYDAFEVLSYSNCHQQGRELPVWYRILNCGFALPACGGTDACVNRLTDRPLGGYRTYAMGGSQLDYWDWLAAVCDGRSFVTNGPLFTSYDVDGFCAGDTFEITGSEPVEVDVSFAGVSVLPVSRADVVVNGGVAASVWYPEGAEEFDETVAVNVSESSWVAVRLFGEVDDWFAMGDSLFAHTNPVYIEKDGARILDTEDAQYFVDWLDDLELLGETRGEWGAAADSVRFFEAVTESRDYFEALAEGVATAVGEDDEACARLALATRPNPTQDRVLMEAPPGGQVIRSVRIYDCSGRLVRTVVPEGNAPRSGAVWDAADELGHPVASGVYLCRAELAGGGEATGKVVVLR